MWVTNENSEPLCEMLSASELGDLQPQVKTHEEMEQDE